MLLVVIPGACGLSFLYVKAEHFLGSFRDFNVWVNLVLILIE